MTLRFLHSTPYHCTLFERSEALYIILTTTMTNMYIVTILHLVYINTGGVQTYIQAKYSQQTRALDPMLFRCWTSAVGSGPLLKQHWVKSLCLLGCQWDERKIILVV